MEGRASGEGNGGGEARREKIRIIGEREKEEW